MTTPNLLISEILHYLDRFGDKGRQIPFIYRHVSHLLSPIVPDQPDTLRLAIQQLKAEGLIRTHQHQYIITEAGQAYLARQNDVHPIEVITA